MLKKLLYTAILISLYSAGYTQDIIKPFGKVDNSELLLQQCDFEKDANAMVLFDKADVYFDDEFNIIQERHKRIKIFNDKGKSEANIRIEYISGSRYEDIYGIQAQTINLKDGKQEIVKLEKKLIYTEAVDKSRSAIVFSFPNVQSGSVIEFKYTWKTLSYSNFPDWDFQEDIPVKYSELTTSTPEMLYYTVKSRIKQPLVKNSTKPESKTLGAGATAFTYNVEIRTLSLGDVPSLRNEPFMSSRRDNLQSILFQLTSVKPTSGFTRTYADSWAKIGGVLADDEDFGLQLKKKLTGEDLLITKAKLLKTEKEKIAYLFNEVKSRMKWNGINRWYTNDGTPKAWDTKTGNSTEINLILYHLLKQSGINAYPMIVSTRENGKVYSAFPFLYQFNKTVAYIPVDSANYYVLDATDKYQSFNEIPDNLLNSTGLYIDKDKKRYDLVSIANPNPVKTTVYINAVLSSDGKIEGNAQITSHSYHRSEAVRELKSNGEEKFKEQLINKDNNLKIASIRFEGTDVDTLPLNQVIDFKLDLNGDGDYIYFKPSFFNPMGSNPFINESRSTDIDFSHRDYYAITGIYKIPAGFKAEAMPKSVTMSMPDQSISFRRILAEQDGTISVRYIFDLKKLSFFKESYPDLRDFYKKMHEMLNEQIVLKKSS